MRTAWGTVAAIVVLLAAGCGADESGPESAAAATSSPATTHTVVYAADGDGGKKVASYTWATADGGTEQHEADLPLRAEDADDGDAGLPMEGFESGDMVYLSVQNSQDHGSITCQIIVDGVEVSVHTSTGAYSIATCRGRVP